MPWVLVNQQANPPWLGSSISCSASLSCLFSQPSLLCGVSERSPVLVPWRLCYADEHSNWFITSGRLWCFPLRSLLSSVSFRLLDQGGKVPVVGASITATPFLAQPLEAFQRIALYYSKPSRGRGWGRVWCSGLMSWSLNFPKGTGRSASDACSWRPFLCRGLARTRRRMSSAPLGKHSSSEPAGPALIRKDPCHLRAVSQPVNVVVWGESCSSDGPGNSASSLHRKPLSSTPSLWERREASV